MGAEGFLGKPCFKNIEILLSRLRFIPCSKTILASGMKSPNDGDRDNDQHQYHIDAKAPQQNAGSQRKTLPPKMRPALGRDYLVDLEHRQNGTRILQRDLFGIRRGHVNFPMTLGGSGVI